MRLSPNAVVAMCLSHAALPSPRCARHPHVRADAEELPDFVDEMDELLGRIERVRAGETDCKVVTMRETLVPGQRLHVARERARGGRADVRRERVGHRVPRAVLLPAAHREHHRARLEQLARVARLGLQQQRVRRLERKHRAFVRGGAREELGSRRPRREVDDRPPRAHGRIVDVVVAR